MDSIERTVRTIVAEALAHPVAEVGPDTEVSIAVTPGLPEDDPVLRRIQAQFATDFTPLTHRKHSSLVFVLVFALPLFFNRWLAGAVLRVVPENPPVWTETTAFLFVVMPVWVAILLAARRWGMNVAPAERRVRVSQLVGAVRRGAW
jgi:hypothetical protein